MGDLAEGGQKTKRIAGVTDAFLKFSGMTRETPDEEFHECVRLMMKHLGIKSNVRTVLVNLYLESLVVFCSLFYIVLRLLLFDFIICLACVCLGCFCHVHRAKIETTEFDLTSTTGLKSTCSWGCLA